MRVIKSERPNRYKKTNETNLIKKIFQRGSNDVSMKNTRLFRLKKPLIKIKEGFWKNLRDDFVNFCETTTVHGFRHVAARGAHPIERILWIVLICFLTYFGYSVSMVQVNRYLTNPTVVSIQKNYRDWITIFPAVTICLTEPFDEDLVKAYIQKYSNILKQWNVSESDEKFPYYYEFVTLVVRTTLRKNPRLYWKYDLDPTVESLDIFNIISEVISEVEIRTSLHNREHKVIWETVITEMGVCKTFNSIFSRYQSLETYKMQKYDKKKFSSIMNYDSLLKCHYMNKRCYARFNIVNKTGEYFIHSPFEIAEPTSNPSGVIDEGEELDAEFIASFNLAGKNVRALTVQQRGCKYPQEPISKYIPAYSNALCQIECRTRLAIVFCGCRPFFYTVGDSKPCDAKGMSCIGRNMEVLINIPTNLADCSCIPQCTEMNYTPNFKKISLWNSSRVSVFDVKATAKFSLKTPKVVMHKDIIFSFEDLVASIGGTGALFLGVSFLSMIEILLCLCKPFKHLIVNVKINRQQK